MFVVGRSSRLVSVLRRTAVVATTGVEVAFRVNARSVMRFVFIMLAKGGNCVLSISVITWR